MNAITRGKIHVAFLTMDNKITKIVEVDANLLGGEEGVFATCRDPDNYEMVWLIAGDDGFWQYIGCYHQDWLPGILVTIKRA